MSRPLRDDDFTINLTRGETFIGIFRGNTNKKLTVLSNQHYLYPFMIKPRRKSIDRSPKLIVFSNVETTFRRHTFLYGELQCLPRGDPRNLCANTRIRLLATHSLKVD